jgi:glucose/arabinose dehydrogenase
LSAPVALIPAHASADGIVFYSGTDFGAEYRGDAFSAEYGDTIDGLGTGHVVQVVHFGKRVTVSTFATGFVNPLAVVISPNGSLLVADWGRGTVWRIRRG